MSDILAPVASPTSLEKMAYEAIKEAILSFRLKPGETLVEADLARQLSISKTPVRDALSRLEKEGFITKIPYKGYYVSEVSRETIIEIFEIRAVLEGLACRLAAPLLTAEDLTALGALLDQHAAAAVSGNIALASQLNRRFHDAVIQKSANRWLADTLAHLDEHLRRYRTLSNFQSGRLEKSVDEHRAILNALASQATAQAEEAARQHLLSVSADLAAQDFKELVQLASSQAATPNRSYPE